MAGGLQAGRLQAGAGRRRPVPPGRRMPRRSAGRAAMRAAAVRVPVLVEAAALQQQAVVAEHLAVVAHEHYQRAIVRTGAFRRRQHPADPRRETRPWRSTSRLPPSCSGCGGHAERDRLRDGPVRMSSIRGPEHDAAVSARSECGNGLRPYGPSSLKKRWVACICQYSAGLAADRTSSCARRCA